MGHGRRGARLGHDPRIYTIPAGVLVTCREFRETGTCVQVANIHRYGDALRGTGRRGSKLAIPVRPPAVGDPITAHTTSMDGASYNMCKFSTGVQVRGIHRDWDVLIGIGSAVSELTVKVIPPAVDVSRT